MYMIGTSQATDYATATKNDQNCRAKLMYDNGPEYIFKVKIDKILLDFEQNFHLIVVMLLILVKIFFSTLKTEIIEIL